MPSQSLFAIRISMPFQDLSHRRAASIAHMTASKFRELTRAEEGDALAHGIELYLCPESDRGTEKLFQYLRKVNAVHAHDIPLPSHLGIQHVAAQDKAKMGKHDRQKRGSVQRSVSFMDSDGAEGMQRRNGSLRRSLSRKQSMSSGGADSSDDDYDQGDEGMDGVIHQVCFRNM